MRRTKTDAALEASADAHEDDPQRANVIHCARRFKGSWIELAEALTEVSRSGQWKTWGYPSFDDYTRQELHLKKETVDKLTGSFLFLRKRAPEVLARDGVRDHIPSYNAVDFLRRAEEEDKAPVEIVDTLRKRVLEDAAPMPSVTKEFRDVVFPISEGQKKERDAAALRNVASRLRELLGGTKAVPKRLAGEVTQSLDALLEALGVDEERAA